LLSKGYASARSKLIDMAKANCDVGPGRALAIGNDTTYLCAVDSEGNMVSYIQSNYSSFGSGVVAAGTGFVLQNRGGLFSLDPASPTCSWAESGRYTPSFRHS
jgi:gamma-glutamyltranspeptidase/glutathione hydrolase